MALTIERLYEEDAQAVSSKAHATDRYPRSEGLILALFALVAALFGGYELVFRYNIVYVDAWTRSLEALYAVMRPQFHLAGMGFVWNPLPALMSIPAAELRYLWPPLMQLGFADNINSAIFAGIAVFHLNRILWRFGFNKPVRISWTILYLANPLIFLYSANGMTDGMMCAASIACMDGVIEYFTKDRLSGMIRASVWIAVGFMLRYEAVPIGGMMVLGIFIAEYRRSGSYKKAEGTSFIYLLLVVSAGVIWMLLNWMIMKNPFFFADSRYSNSAQIGNGSYNNPFMLAADHHLPVAISEVFRFTILFWPFPVAAGVTLFAVLRKRADQTGWPILLASLGTPLLQVALLYKHASAEWARFFIYYIPFGFLLCAYAIWTLSRGRSARLLTVLSILLIPMIGSADYIAFRAIQNPTYGNGDSGFVGKILHKGGGLGRENSSGDIASGKMIGHYINAHPHLVVLLSSFTSFAAVPYVNNPSQLVMSNDSDYMSVLTNPRGQVNAILVSHYTESNKNRMNAMYPGLWAGRLSWTKLAHAFPNGDRLYYVLSDAP